MVCVGIRRCVLARTGLVGELSLRLSVSSSEEHSPSFDSEAGMEQVLETLREISKHLQNIYIFASNNIVIAAIKSRLDLEIRSDSILFTNPNLFSLSKLVRDLKTLVEKLEKFQGYEMKSILHRPIINYKIAQVACAIEAEIQACDDRENIRNLVKTFQESDGEEDKKVRVLTEFANRVSEGFDGDFQDLILKEKVFSILESLICNSRCSKRVRENAAVAISALANFNKNVFVGLVLMGRTIEALISMESSISIEVLSSLINLIRSPLIDEIQCKGEIPKIINLLSSENLSVKVAAMDCICQIAYFGRREVIEDLLEEGLIKKLMELQRKINTVIYVANEMGETMKIENEKDNRIKDKCEFSDCVLRFAVQLEVGEGLSRKEKKELKMEILKRIREASVSEAEAAAIVAEVLWGSSP